VSRRLARELAERCRDLEQSLGPIEAERRVFEALCRGGISPEIAADLYQDFLAVISPAKRRSKGVYYTPSRLVRAQVRLVDALLRQRLGCVRGFGDQRVLTVDPAAGSGAYPLAIVDHVGSAEITSRMRLFEPQPGAAAIGRALGLPIEERDALEASVSLTSPIVVCLGNPPYRRGMSHPRKRPLLDPFRDGAPGVHVKNLHNDYVYFWRWALRSVFEDRAGAGIVSLVTPASYLRGPAFGGLRQALRATLDELWVLDLEGDHLAARKTDNVFAIRTPVAVALGVRYGAGSNAKTEARVHYARIAGNRDTKLATLDSLKSVEDLRWQPSEAESFVPRAGRTYERWPRLTDLFPWQLSGAQLKRTWPIGPTPQVLRDRWRALMELPPEQRARAFRETRDRSVRSAPRDLRDPDTRLTPLVELCADSDCLEPVPYAYRSFDRQWVLPDARLGDFMRPALWRVRGPRQIFLTSLLTNVLGPGPAAVATALVPDLDHFRGSFGARAVIPLWCDAEATRPNVAAGVLEGLSNEHGFEVTPEALLAYCYALLSPRAYARRFEDELRTPGARVPMTHRPALFQRAVALGERMLASHTYRAVPRGQAGCMAPVGDDYPARSGFAYDQSTRHLQLGSGSVGPISVDVWDYSISGLRVVPSWLRRRLPRSGASPLDAIGLRAWTRALTCELLELLWLLEATVSAEPELEDLLEEIVSGGHGQTRPRPASASKQTFDSLGTERSRENVALARIATELEEARPL
jgi:hypothetical protein